MNLHQSIQLLSALLVNLVSPAQIESAQPTLSPGPKLIAVVNRANWCGICRANGPRFEALLRPYASQGVRIYTNDLTNATTKAASETELQQAQVYEAITTEPRKGISKLLKACGMIHDKKQLSDVSGIVTFVDPKTHRQLAQLSIALSDQDMKRTIDNLLHEPR